MGDKRKPGPCPVCNGPHDTMMFPLRAQGAPPARERLEALAKRWDKHAEMAQGCERSSADHGFHGLAQTFRYEGGTLKRCAADLRAALAESPPASEGQAPSPAMLDLLEDVWRQFAIEVEDRPGVRFAHLTTLEEVEEVLTKAGRLRRVRPDKDWCEPVQDLPSPAPAPAAEGPISRGALAIIERTVEASTGVDVDTLRRTPLDEMPPPAPGSTTGPGTEGGR